MNWKTNNFHEDLENRRHISKIDQMPEDPSIEITGIQYLNPAVTSNYQIVKTNIKRVINAF